MGATRGDLVRFHYDGRGRDGKVVVTTRQGDPAELVLGNEAIPGFNEKITGMEAGETRTMTLTPENGFGHRREELVFSLARDTSLPTLVAEEGEAIKLESPESGELLPVRVVSVSDTEVILDANHPLAGITIEFEIEALEVVPTGLS